MAKRTAPAITEDDRRAAERLKTHWLSMPNRPTQQALADAWPFSKSEANQSLISQYMGGKIPLNHRAVLFFAQELGIAPEAIRSDLPELQMGPRVGEPASEYANWAEVLAYSAAVGLGDGEEAQEYAVTHGLKFRRDSLRRKGLLGADLAILYGKGDSMEPVIQTGDAVMFNRDDRIPRHEELYVVQLPGVNLHDQISVKQAELVGDIVTFRALNPEGDHQWRRPRLMLDKRNPITVVGKVCWVGKWT